MGQTIPSLYTVILDEDNPNNNIYGSIQEAINKSNLGTTIVLTNNIFSGKEDVIYLKSGCRFVGLDGATIMSDLRGEATDLLFENVLFQNSNNASLKFSNIKGVTFRNCTFLINIIGDHPKVIFGILLSNVFALFQSCTFLFNVENANTLVTICATNNSTNITLQSPIIKVEYRNVQNIETYFYNSTKNLNSCFEAFSSSIHYFDKKDDNRCRKQQCKDLTSVRLFRGVGCVNASLISTKIHFAKGGGKFNIACGNEITYINGLTVSTNRPHHWEIGHFSNIFLTSFMSNLKCACEVGERNCIRECSPSDCTIVPLPPGY